MDQINRADAAPSFYNEWVDIQELSPAGEEEFRSLDREYMYVGLVKILFFAGIGGIILLLFIMIAGFSFKINLFILIGFLLFIFLRSLLVVLEFRYLGYAVREKDIAYRSGWIIRHRQYIPFRRVQHCKISESMIERLFNFATVVVSAAGDNIVIHGLRPEEALSLQQWINEKVDRLTKEMRYEEE